jgi:hypothetical protein
MVRRNFLHIAGGGVVLAATAGLTACSTALPPEAVAAWRNPGANATDVRHWVLSHAVLAPHAHNLQSWLVDLSQPDEITLYCDLLDLAARQKGLRADIELFPQGAFGPSAIDKRPVARIRLTPDASVRPDPLFAQILQRHTNREAYEARDPAPAALQAMAASAAALPVRVGFAGAAQPELVAPLRTLAMQAWQIELTTPRTILESYKVLRVGPTEIAQHRDGISLNTPMVRMLAALGLFDRSKAPGPGDTAITGQIKDFNAKLATTPAFFWLVTEGNGRVSQISAGRAYVRAQLAATAHGLSMHPLSQALQEYPEQAKPYAAIHDLLQAPSPRYTVQMWTRLGHAPAIGPTPRRGLDAHLVKA